MKKLFVSIALLAMGLAMALPVFAGEACCPQSSCCTGAAACCK